MRRAETEPTMTNIFTETFPSNAYQGNKITAKVDGFTVVATIHTDDCGDAPWDRSGGHGPVSEWTTRDKAPGERVLNVNGSRKRFYDYAAAIALAKLDGWDAKPYKTGTKGEQAVRAVESDFKFLQGWCKEDWQYVGVAVQVFRDDVELTGEYDHALWGIESINAEGYLDTVAEELVADALDAARGRAGEIVAKLAQFA